MKPPERFPPDDPREWLNRAKGNLARAKAPVPGGYLEDLCFDAQQASEKAIKALLISRRIDFPYTHDLSHPTRLNISTRLYDTSRRGALHAALRVVGAAARGLPIAPTKSGNCRPPETPHVTRRCVLQGCRAVTSSWSNTGC